MRIVGDPRRRGEAAIVVRHENREEGLGGGRGGETPQAQLLDEAILERAVGALDPALRLRTVGAETVDVEVAEGAAELGESGAALGAIGRRAPAEPRGYLPLGGERTSLSPAPSTGAKTIDIVDPI